MKITTTQFSCDHPNHLYNKYITISLQKGDQLLENAICEGKKLASKVNPNDPGGVMRTAAQIQRRCICGSLAELSVRYLLNNEITNRNINATLLQSTTITDGPKYGNQIDIPIIINEKQFEIEVRSSFPYTDLSGVITKRFDIIGWYQTFSKPGEHAKDYYLRVLYNFNEYAAMNYIESKIDLHFVGGATKEMLEKIGHWDDFDQHGANYRSIKPICAALDAKQIMDKIFT